MFPSLKVDEPIIKLNVGGIKFLTTQSTLAARGENLLTRILEHKRTETLKIVTDKKGYIFIDRNGRKFEAVLEYLRTGVFEPIPPFTREQILTELDYYQIQAPTHHVFPAKQAIISSLREAREQYWHSANVVKSREWLVSVWPTMSAIVAENLRKRMECTSFIWLFSWATECYYPARENKVDTSVPQNVNFYDVANWIKRLYGLDCTVEKVRKRYKGFDGYPYDDQGFRLIVRVSLHVEV
mmetsp:Transcript_11441/g.12554  ORF Transcript_11441/g.12554 Transcript_11441/m.12554 type:complete len:240 (-) Transcript_11441:99-818(-)